MKCHLTLALVLLPLFANAASDRTVTALQAESPPALDGKLDEAVWSGATWKSEFTELGTDGASEAKTSFAVAYDDDFLYLAVRCAEPDGTGALKATSRDRDSREVYLDDSIEFFVAPGTQRTDYFQFQINAAGSVADAAGRQSGTVLETSWTSRIEVTTHKGEMEWTVEAAIPLADLEFGPGAVGDWGINVVRVRRAGGKEELLTFIPMTGSFHQPALFAPLALPGADFSTRQWDVSPPMGWTVVSEEDRLILKTKVSVKNLTGKPRPVTFSARLQQGGKDGAANEQKDILDAGQSKTYDLELPLAAEGKQDLVMEMADRRGGAKSFVRRILPVNLTYNPLTLVLKAPAYQSAIYPTEKLDQIRGVLRLAIGEQALAKASLRVTFASEGSNQEFLAETNLAELKPEMSFSLPIPALKEGRYVLRVEMTESGSASPRVLERVIRKLPPPPGGVEWRISETGILLRDGEPFLPVGWFSLGAPGMEDFGGVCNVSWDYLGPWQNVAELREYLDGIAKAGGYAVIYPTVNNRRAEDITTEPLKDEEIKLIRERVRALKDHPALLAWYLADEPEYHRVLPEVVVTLRQIISEEDPYHPTIVVNNVFAAIRQFSGGGDVLAPDPYPFFKRGGHSPGIERVGRFIAEAATVALSGQTVWGVLQAHDTRDFGGKGERAPNFTESRNMVWQSVIAGARGVIWWDWGWVNPNTVDSVLGNAYVARELQALKDYVFAPQAGGVTVSSSSNLSNAARRVVGDQELVMVVNNATTEQEVTLEIPSLCGRELVVIGEGRTVTLGADGVLSEKLPLYGSRLYATDSALTALESLATTQEKIDAANAARKQPGNLAFEDSGVATSVSSTGMWAPTSVWMVDGMREGRAWRAAEFTGADTIDLVWPKPQAVGRVVLYSDTIASFTVQIPNKDDDVASGWRDVATVSDVSASPATGEFPMTSTTRLRLKITGLRSGAKASNISEIEAYEK